MKNLVITGLGAVTPIGIGVDNYWQGILDMKCGIEKITRFHDEDIPITIAGEVKDFDPKNYMSPKLTKETGTFIQFAYASAKGGVINMTRQAAIEWATKGVTVNALCPGFFASEANGPEAMEAMNDFIETRSAMCRPGNPGELDYIWLQKSLHM